MLKPIPFKQHPFGWLLAASIVCLVAVWAAWASVQRSGFHTSKRAFLASSLFQGSISEISGSPASPAALAISGRNGSLLRLAVDPQETVVLQGGKVTTANHLEKGQQVKAHYILKNGRETARTIEITDPLPMPAPTDKPVPGTAEKPMSKF